MNFFIDAIGNNYTIRREWYNYPPFCSKTIEHATALLFPNGTADLYFCLKNSKQLSDTGSVYYKMVQMVESASETLTNLTTNTSLESVNASSVSAAEEPLVSLATPGLMVGGAALVGVTAVLAYIYRDQIRSGLSSAYNSATAYFDTAKTVVEQALPMNTFNKQLESKLVTLDRISKSLKRYALGSVEKDKLTKVVHATRTILEEIKSKGVVNAKALQARTEEVKASLNKIAFEGKGVEERGKQDASYIKRAMICAARALRNIFSFIGQFIASGEYNPVAKALLNRSFFISTPTTAREERDIKKAKDSLLDTMLSASFL